MLKLHPFLFKNISPSTRERDTCRQLLETLREEAPYDSAIEAYVEKIENGFWASVHIFSGARPFYAKAFASNPLTAAHEAFSLVRKRVQEWKHSRGPLVPGALGGPLPSPA
jgi:hypothetical protein